MDGLQKIVGNINADALRHSAETESVAREKAKKIVDDAHVRGQEMIKKAENDAKSEYDKIVARIRAAVRVDGKNRILKKKREIIDKTIDTAYEKLMRLDGKRYTEYVKSRLNPDVTHPEGEVLLSVGDTKTISEIRKAVTAVGLRISDDRISGDSGCIIRCKDFEKNYTFKAVINSKKDEICDRLRDIYFGEGDI